MAPKRGKNSDLGPSKSKRNEAQELETENDFLESADAMENSMSKWRVGDPEKAIRFFQRALDVYDQGLSRFPNDFDLVYNKAHLQYELTQDHVLSKHVESLQLLLQHALHSHRTALSLDRNSDVLFNTAQVASSYAEELHETGEQRLSSESVKLLIESIELFEECLTRQEGELKELKLAKQNIENSVMDSEAEISAPFGQENTGSNEQEWARVETEITPSDLIDTALALLEAIGLLIKIIAETVDDENQSRSKLSDLSQMGDLILKTKLLGYVDLLSSEPRPAPVPCKSEGLKVLSLRTGSVQEMDEPLSPMKSAKRDIVIGTAVYRTRLVAAQFQTKLISVLDYASQLAQVFESAPKDFPFPSFYFFYVEALQDFSSHISGAIDIADNQITRYRWEALAKADSLLAQSLTVANSPTFQPSSDPGFTDKASIYLLRGDVELHRRHLALLPSASPSIVASAQVLLKNAGVYYRCAVALSKAGLQQQIEREANIKARIAQNMEAGISVNSPDAYVGLDTREVGKVLQEMIDDEMF